MSTKPHRALLAAFLIALFPGAILPQQAPQKPPATPPPKPAEVKPDYSQEPFIIEQFQTLVQFESDGAGRREQKVRIRVQSEAGVQQLGQLVFGYNSANERLEIASVEVRKADGTVTLAAKDSIQDMTAPVARTAPVYTDYRQKHVTVPGLAPGETLSYHIVASIHTALAPGHFWFEHDFVKDAIVLDEQLEVDVPRDRIVKLKTQPGAEPVVAEEGARRIYRWKSSYLRREDEDQGDAKPKKKAKKKYEFPAVQLTTFQSWEEVGRWYAPLERARATPDTAIRAKAAELVRGRSTQAEKLRALYDYVARNFRYVSLSFGVGRYQPHAASDVLANQYGDCKDKHTLLEAMIEAIGLRAYPVLIHSSRKIDPDVPSPAQFDHMITAIPPGPSNKDWIWLDTTTEVAPFQMLAAGLRKKQALLIPVSAEQAPGGAASAPTKSGPAEIARLMETPGDLPFPATQRVEVEAQVSELGKLTAHVRYTLRGDAELLLRLAFRRTPQNQWLIDKYKALGAHVVLGDGLGHVDEARREDAA